MDAPTRKATFTLHTNVLDAITDAVSHGVAPSKNALVERALRKELREVERDLRRARWQAAMRDPLFVKDLEDIEADFEAADTETIRNLD